MGFALVYLVALPILAGDLAGLLVAVHCGGHGQQAQARQPFDITLHVVGVQHFNAHHLVATADAHYSGPLATGPYNSLGATVAAQFIQVVQGGLGAGQDDDVGLLDVLGIVGIEQVHA